MELNINNTELNYLLEIVNKEIELLSREIHRTDALNYKHDLEQKESILKDLAGRLRQTN